MGAIPRPETPRLDSVPPFLAIRHGETAWNLEGRFQGHSDIPLCEQGRHRTARLAESLVSRLRGDPSARRPAVVLSSPLRRAVETAEVLCQRLGMPRDAVVIDERLREVSFGTWEGLTTLEVKERFPDERRARKRDRWNFAPPRGQSHADAAEAMSSLLCELPCVEIPVLVTHSGNIRALYYLLAGYGETESAGLAIGHHAIISWDGRRLEQIAQ